MSAMTRYTDKELEKLLDETESDLAERRETWQGDAPDKGRQAVCVFANDRTYEQRLAACKMIVAPEVPIPTVTGVLTLARNPRDWLPCGYIQFLRFAGTRWSDPVVDEALCEGPLSALVRRVDDKLDSHHRTAVDIASGPVEKRTRLFPRVALQQLVRNVVLHRTYEGTNAPARYGLEGPLRLG